MLGHCYASVAVTNVEIHIQCMLDVAVYTILSLGCNQRFTMSTHSPRCIPEWGELHLPVVETNRLQQQLVLSCVLFFLLKPLLWQSTPWCIGCHNASECLWLLITALLQYVHKWEASTFQAKTLSFHFQVGMTLEICLDEDDVRARVRIKEGFPVPPWGGTGRCTSHRCFLKWISGTRRASFASPASERVMT